MFHSHRLLIETTHLQQRRHVDYLERRLRRMVQSVFKQELAVDESCPFGNKLKNKDEHVFIKGAWSAVIVVCIVVFAYQSYERISYYLTYPVAVDVFITRSPVNQFPELTICYLNIEGIFDLMDKYKVPCKIVPIEVLMRHTQGLSTDDIWRIANSSSVVISAHEINGAHIVPLKQRAEPLTWATCTAFQGSNIDNAGQKGEHYFNITFKKSSRPCGNKRFVKAVYIYDHGDMPMLRQLYTIPTEFNNEIAITKRKFLFINRRNNPCISSSELRACMENCFVKFIYQIGADKCRFPFYPSKTNSISNICLTSNETAEYWLALRDYMNGVTNNNCSCSRKCDHNTFDEQPMTRDKSGNTSYFVLRYYSPYVTLVKERLCYGLVDLLCDIGGNSGLLIGLSLLSVFQLGHAAVRSRKKSTQFSERDPLYWKVLKTYSSWRKQVYGKNPISRKAKPGKVAVFLKTFVLLAITGLFVMCLVNRVTYFFEYPMQKTVVITFNMSLETPSLILCPGNTNIMKLQKKVAESRNIANACDVNLWELFELSGVNYTHVWQDKKMKPVINYRGLNRQPAIPFYDGTCIELSSGSFLIPPNSMNLFIASSDPLCGTFHLAAYVRSSTGLIDYYSYKHIAHLRGQQLMFIFKEIHIDQMGVPCISTEENEQCVTTCLNKKLFNQISCRLPYMPKADLPLCLSSPSVRQAHLAFRDVLFLSGNTEDCNCLPKCQQRFLEIGHFIQDEVKEKTWVIFGPSHNIVESYVTRPAYTVVKLLCDLGGLLGSTLGLCILGTVETILSLMSTYLKKINKR